MAEWASFEKMLGADAFDASISPERADQDSEEDVNGPAAKPRSRSSSISSSASSKSRSSHRSRSSSASSRSPSPKASAKEKSKSSSPIIVSHSKSPKRDKASDSEEQPPDSTSAVPVIHIKEDRKKSRSRSRSRGRWSRSRDRKRRRHRSRSRGRRSRDRKGPKSKKSPSRRKRSHSRERRRSRSRSKGRRRSRSYSRGRRSSSRSRGHRRRSRSGSRGKSRRKHSRSRSRDRRRDRRRHSPGRRRYKRRHGKSRSRTPQRKQNAPLSFKEKLKQSLMEVQKQATAGTLNMEDFNNSHLVSKERPSNLPLNAANPLMALAMSGGQVTPQQALLQTMAAMHQKAQELTGVAVPKYYNPAAVNPLKYAEQVQKRKLLWGKKQDKPEDDASKNAVPASSTAIHEASASASAAAGTPWKGMSFDDKDGKMTAKFRKLMGIKENEGAQSPEDTNDQGKEQLKKQEEIFQRLDQEYEFARMATHTHRGIGLGFTSHYQQYTGGK